MLFINMGVDGFENSEGFAGTYYIILLIIFDINILQYYY